MEKDLDKPHFSFLWGFSVGLISKINPYPLLLIFFILIGIFMSTSYNWKQDIKDMIEEEKKDMRRDSHLWLANLVALLCGLGSAYLLGYYLHL